MSQLLLFGGQDSQQGWHEFKEIDNKFLEQLHSKQGRASKNPKVSIPSPFARFELIQSAFRNVTKEKGNAEVRDKRLVFYSLDVAQFFFENQQGLQTIVWNLKDCIEELDNSSVKGHRTLAKSLKLYSQKEKYGFDKTDSISIILYRDIVLGCTSPTSLFMCTPNYLDIDVDIELQGNAKLFANQKHLHERDEQFIVYMYRTIGTIQQRFSNYYSINDEKDFPLFDVYRYLEAEEKLLKPSVSNKIKGWKDEIYDFTESYVPSGVSVFGNTLYQLEQEDVQRQIGEISSFTIKPTKSVSKRPLVLTNHKGVYDGWNYISEGKPWKYCIKNSNVFSKDKTHLPMSDNADVVYNDGWLCENDFLDDVLIRLPYPLNTEKFFDGNLKPAKIHHQQKNGKTTFYYYYLPPIKKKFFEFFDHDYLQEKVGKSTNLKIEEQDDGSVIVTLRIAVAGGYVCLQREYKDSGTSLETMRASGPSNNPYEAVGSIVECPVALTIMPFAKLDDRCNHYSIQAMKSIADTAGFDLKITAFKKGNDRDVDVKLDGYKRSDNTFYYTLDNQSFDYISISFEKTISGIDKKHEHNAVLIPLFKSQQTGQKGLNFAFDFGTTNSYIAVKKDDNSIDEVSLNGTIVSTIRNDANLQQIYDDDMITIQSFMGFQDQEFIPNSFGTTYKFPHRTVLSHSKSTFKIEDQLSSLQQLNIPFIYGKDDYGQDANDVETGFKWGEKQKLIYAFIDEMARIAYAYAVKNSANLSECTFIWTYPLSMAGSTIKDIEGHWKECFIKYFKNNKNLSADDVDGEKEVVKMTESIAPFLKYCESGAKAAEMSLSIDIGGGTSDIVFYKNATDIKIASIRFAADCIFNGGSQYAKDNKMINKYYSEYSKILKDENEKIRRLVNNFCGKTSQTKPSEANSVLFSLEDNPNLKTKISYNKSLSNDSEFKILFIYFYAAIIYYLVDILKTYNYPKPERLLFSGTGSKLLNIIGNTETLRDITTQLITKFSDNAYQYTRGDVEIMIERKRPKQLTAEGALWDKNNENSNSVAEIFQSKKREVDELVIDYSMIPSEKKDKPSKALLNKDILDKETMSHITSKVEDFHQKLSELAHDKKKFDLVDDYGCSETSIDVVDDLATLSQEELYSKLLNVFLTRHARKDLESNPEDVCSDVALFFCPVIDIINDFLLK